jgi:hypothetical protein
VRYIPGTCNSFSSRHRSCGPGMSEAVDGATTTYRSLSLYNSDFISGQARSDTPLELGQLGVNFCNVVGLG